MKPPKLTPLQKEVLLSFRENDLSVTICSPGGFPVLMPDNIKMGHHTLYFMKGKGLLEYSDGKYVLTELGKTIEL